TNLNKHVGLQESILSDNTECAAAASGASGVGQEGVFFNPNWGVGFNQFNRHISNIADAVWAGILAIVDRAAPIASIVMELQMQRALAFRVDARRDNAKLRAAGTCGHTVSCQFSKRSQHNG